MNSYLYPSKNPPPQLLATPGNILKKNKLPKNDQNISSFQSTYNRSSRNSHNHMQISSLLNTLSCSINLIQPLSQGQNSKNISSALRNVENGSKMLGDQKRGEQYQQKKKVIQGLQKKEVVGKGGFGKVWRVIIKGSGAVCALKEMSKALVIAKKSVPSVMNQKQLLQQLKNHFLVNLFQAYQDRNNLYLILDYLPGKDLRYHLARKKFSQEEAKFIIVCVLLGLQYLHSNRVIHRDIKPENIVLDQNGYARITDLGIARLLRPNNQTDTSGTPGYMAPQVLCRQNHTYSVDYFAVGVMTYEFMFRRRPFHGRSRKEIREQVLARQPQIKKLQAPQQWSLESIDFVNRLLQRKPAQRLGHNSIDQIFKHPWLRGFPVARVNNKSVQAPWRPDLNSLECESQQFSSQETEMKELMAQNELMLRKQEVQDLFQGYEYNRPNNFSSK